MPDVGEKESEDGKRFPSDLLRSTAIKKTPDGFTYIDPAQFQEFFAADLSAQKAAFMARSQAFNFADNFSATITTAAMFEELRAASVPAEPRELVEGLRDVVGFVNELAAAAYDCRAAVAIALAAGAKTPSIPVAHLSRPEIDNSVIPGPLNLFSVAYVQTE